MDYISILIFNERKAKGWSQTNLADNVQCSPKTVSNLENGKNINLGIFKKILHALDLTIS